MRESINKYFYVGTITWMSYPGMKQEDVLRKLAADDFFNAVEVSKCLDNTSRELRCRKLLEQSHMKVCYGAQPRLLGPKVKSQ